MVKQNFIDAIVGAERMVVITPDSKRITGFFSRTTLDRETMSDKWFAYDVKHDDTGTGLFAKLCHNYVMLNSGGTFFTQTKIPELSKSDSFVKFRINQEDTENLWDYEFI